MTIVITLSLYSGFSKVILTNMGVTLHAPRFAASPIQRFDTNDTLGATAHVFVYETAH
ncbi:MAG TPA: hypothetical protein VKJ65_11660 [Phycisphaerae bacterium]|nr:hypothetical protein [Phycisphaerae bacterium]